MNARVERSQGKGKDKEVMKEESIGRERSERKGKGQRGRGKVRKARTGKGDTRAHQGVPGSLIQGEKGA